MVRTKLFSRPSALLVVLTAASTTALTVHLQGLPPTAAGATASATESPSLAEAQAAVQRADDIARYRDEVSLQGQRARRVLQRAGGAPARRRRHHAYLEGRAPRCGCHRHQRRRGPHFVRHADPEFAQSRHVFIRDRPEFVRQLKQAGIYTIGRVVCFNDPILPNLYPDRAVIDTRPGHVGQVWNLHKGRNTWLNPYNERNHDLLISLAREVQSLGFDEIQLDYIRFPVDEGTKFATFPGEGEKPRRAPRHAAPDG